MKSRHAARVSALCTIVHPAGTSLNAGHNECCPSSLTRTWYVPFSSSNGLVTIFSSGLDSRLHSSAQHTCEHGGYLSSRTGIQHVVVSAIHRMGLDLPPHIRPPQFNRRPDFGLHRGKQADIAKESCRFKSPYKT